MKELRMKELREYFVMSNHCYLVKGFKRGAIYNLINGAVYSIDERATKLLDELNHGFSIKESWQKVRYHFIFRCLKLMFFLIS